jgi:hypothetical protein
MRAQAFKGERVVKERERAEEEKRRGEEERERVAEILRKNKGKVDEIQRREMERVESLYQQRELKLKERDLYQEKLDKAVEGYAFRPQAEADPERLIQETAAREIRKITVHDAADQVSLFKNPGYNVDGLMKDIRFKISTALAEAGLSGTTYG